MKELKNRISALLAAVSVIISVSASGCNIADITNTSAGQTTPSHTLATPPPDTEPIQSSEETTTAAPPTESSATTPPPVTTTEATAETPPPETTSVPPPTESTVSTPPATTTATPPVTTVITTLPITTPAATTTIKPPTPVTPDPPDIKQTVASGKVVYENDYALIDASNASDGYVMVKLKKAMEGNYKVLVKILDKGEKYTYSLANDGGYEVIPLTRGSGNYSVIALKQTSANKGATILKQDIYVNIKDEFSVFLTPTQYCMYDGNSQCVKLASEITAGMNELQKVEAIYEYVINNIDYVPTAENAANGYTPNPDRTLGQKGGICFDYASLMAAMLRSQRLPTKVVVGYAGDVYHAWISVYVKDSGWIDGIISFNGNSWNRMDPTFAASATDEEDYRNLMAYISNNANYYDVYYY